jgi:hypothetical protein
MAGPEKGKNSKIQYLELVLYLLSVLVKKSCLFFKSTLESLNFEMWFDGRN